VAIGLPRLGNQEELVPGAQCRLQQNHVRRIPTLGIWLERSAGSSADVEAGVVDTGPALPLGSKAVDTVDVLRVGIARVGNAAISDV
jgi:hypothetical protein